LLQLLLLLLLLPLLLFLAQLLPICGRYRVVGAEQQLALLLLAVGCWWLLLLVIKGGRVGCWRLLLWSLLLLSTKDGVAQKGASVTLGEDLLGTMGKNKMNFY
jgi:hypothetical protein